jgi:hypothetical protein
LQLFYSIRSERLLMEQMDYNLLFRWFVGLEIDDKVWDGCPVVLGARSQTELSWAHPGGKSEWISGGPWPRKPTAGRNGMTDC